MKYLVIVNAAADSERTYNGPPALSSSLTIWRKRMGIEPTKPLLAQSFIGFEDRGRHQSDARFRTRYHMGFATRQGVAN